MKINQLWCAISGHRESNLTYKYGSDGYKKIKLAIKQQVLSLMRCGVVNWIGGLQNGADEYISMTVLEQRDIIGTTANLYLVQPFDGMENSFDDRQKRVFNYLKANAIGADLLYDHYVKGCYRKRNKILIDNSDYLLAVKIKNAVRTGTQLMINMAVKKGIEIRIIDPVTYEVERIPAKYPPKLIED